MIKILVIRIIIVVGHIFNFLRSLLWHEKFDLIEVDTIIYNFCYLACYKF